MQKKKITFDSSINSSHFSPKVQRAGRPCRDVEQLEAMGRGQADAAGTRGGGAEAQGAAETGGGETGGAQEEQRWLDDKRLAQEDQGRATRVPQTDSTVLRIGQQSLREGLQVNQRFLANI